MYLHPKTGLCFLAHPRTASRAVRDALLAIGFETIGAHHDGPLNGYDLSPYTVFCGVRNHWDVMVSWWYNVRMHRKEQKPSLGWLAIQLSRNRFYFPPGTGSMHFFLNQLPDIIYFRYENMEAELNTILQVHDLPEVKIPRVGISGDREGRHYREYYTEHTREFVRWCFMPEILRLGYDFDFGDQ